MEDGPPGADPDRGAGVGDGPPVGEIRQEARSAATAAAASGGSSDSGDSSPSAPCSNSSSDIGSEVGTERKAVDTRTGWPPAGNEAAGTGMAGGGGGCGRRDRSGHRRGELSWLGGLVVVMVVVA